MIVNKSNPLISVIIPTYNRSSYVVKAITSVISQSYKNTEIIVIDDNSNDDTENIVKNIDHPILYVKQKENKGGSAARNVGIEIANGDYIAFLDDDDEWLQIKIETQIKRLGDYDASLTGYYRKRAKNHKVVFGNEEVVLKDIFNKNPFPTSGLLVRTDLMKHLKFDESLPNDQDWDVLVGILKGRNIKYVREALYVVDDGVHSRITNKVLKVTGARMENSLRAINKHKEVLGDYWYKYKVAYRYMSYISQQNNRLERFSQGVSRVGVVPVLHVLLDKIIKKLKYAL